MKSLDLPPSSRLGRVVSLGALAAALLGLAALWTAGRSAQASLDRSLREIEHGALPSLVNAHNLAIATERLRVHVEGLTAASAGHRAQDQSAIASDLTALRAQISILEASAWGPAALSSIRDIQGRIQSLQAQLPVQEVAGSLAPFQLPVIDNLTVSLRDLLADSDRLIGLAAQQADVDAQRLQSHSRRALDLQWETSGAFALVFVGLVVWAEEEHRRREQETLRYARMLQGLNAELDSFCGRVAHDLLSPLTPILGSAQLLARGVDPAMSRELGARIARTTTRLEKLIDGLLSLARTQSNSIGSGRSDAADVISVLLTEMAEGIERVGADIRLSLEPTPVGCPPSLLSTVVQNLLDNALKYGRRQGEPPRLTLEARAVEGWGRIRVSDEGPGITAGALGQVFAPYFQEHPGSGGIGLGLATARRVVESFGGTMAVRSEVNVGTTFEVLLPLASKWTPAATSGLPARANA